MNISFIGLGVMGSGMAANLLRAGHRVTVWARRPEQAAPLIAQGAILAPTLAQCVAQAELVLTIVGYPQDVEAVYLGEGGILDHAPQGAVLADMTTSSPALAERLSALAEEKGLRMLDAPVSGGDTGARNGTLTIMVGGPREAFERCMPAFSAMGRTIRHMGPAGAGQHTKMANQIAIAGAISGVCEALAYAQRVGMDAQAVLETISTGAAKSTQMEVNGPKIVRGDYAPTFYMKHFIKDMGLAAEEAGARGLDLPILDATLAAYRRLAERGLGEEGTQALIKDYLDL